MCLYQDWVCMPWPANKQIPCRSAIQPRKVWATKTKQSTHELGALCNHSTTETKHRLTVSTRWLAHWAKGLARQEVWNLCRQASSHSQILHVRRHKHQALAIHDNLLPPINDRRCEIFAARLAFSLRQTLRRDNWVLHLIPLCVFKIDPNFKYAKIRRTWMVTNEKYAKICRRENYAGYSSL